MSSSSLFSEDEQRNNQSSQKALQTVTTEKEAALADLNSVERSLSDVFRRYENLKSTLEGFKKVSGHVHVQITAQRKCLFQVLTRSVGSSTNRRIVRGSEYGWKVSCD